MLKAINVTNAEDGDIMQEIVSNSKEICISKEEKKVKMERSVRTQVDKGKGQATQEARPPMPTKHTVPIGKQPPPKMGEFTIQTTPSFLSAKGWGTYETNSAW